MVTAEELRAERKALQAAKDLAAAKGILFEYDPGVARIKERLGAMLVDAAETMSDAEAVKWPGRAAKAVVRGGVPGLAAAGVGKAFAVPGVVEVLETMGRGDDTPSFEEYGASRGDAVAELLGLATGYSDPSPVRDRRRDAAIRATIESGREGLRPVPPPRAWWDPWGLMPSNIEKPISQAEVEAYQRR
jgi:hypothetical protein